MSVRLAFFLLLFPLFVLLAAANGVLLFVRDSSQMRADLGEQARSAAVVTAAFLAEAPDGRLPPARTAALRAATARAPDLKAIGVVRDPGRPAERLAGVAPTGDPMAVGLVRTPAGAVFRASAVAGAAGLVVADVDAAPYVARRQVLLARIGAMLALSALAGLVLSAWLAGRLTGDVRGAADWIAGLVAALEKRRASVTGAPRPGVREVAELVEAAGILNALPGAHGGGDDAPPAEPSALLASAGLGARAVAQTLGDRAVAFRALGAAQVGAVWAAAPRAGGGGALAVVRLGCDPVAAAALAFQLTPWLEQALASRAAAAVAEEIAVLAPEAETEILVWSPGAKEGTQLACLADPALKKLATAYLELSPDLGPEALLEDIAALAPPGASGIFGVVGAQDTAATASSAVA